jgi:hypothetical protein
MSRETFVYCPVAGAVVEKWRAAAYRGDNGAPSLLDKPQVIGGMPETRHPIDNKVYTSREAYNAVTRAHGAMDIGKAEMRRLMARGQIRPDPAPGVQAAIREALQRNGY